MKIIFWKSLLRICDRRNTYLLLNQSELLLYYMFVRIPQIFYLEKQWALPGQEKSDETKLNANQSWT